MWSTTTTQNTYDSRRATLSMRHDGKYLIAIDRVPQGVARAWMDMTMTL